MNTKLTRIGIFYDGNYFLNISKYYNYTHEIKKRISIAGLHHFVRLKIAELEETDYHLCQIVDAHYFRGRLSAKDASQRENQLYYERIFDDILMFEGVASHYLPVKNVDGIRKEKGVDTLLALEAFELALLKKFDVVVLLVGDSDYVPLVRKLHSLGTRVMLIGWDYEYTDAYGNIKVMRPSQYLQDEVTYPIPMHELIDEWVRTEDAMLNDLFISRPVRQYQPELEEQSETENGDDSEANFNSTRYNSNVSFESAEDLPKERMNSTIQFVKSGYGFINAFPNNIFFHYSALVNRDFNDIQVGDQVEYTVVKNEKGQLVAIDIMVGENAND